MPSVPQPRFIRSRLPSVLSFQHWPLGNRGTISLWEQGSFRAGRRRQVPNSEDQLASSQHLSCSARTQMASGDLRAPQGTAPRPLLGTVNGELEGESSRARAHSESSKMACVRDSPEAVKEVKMFQDPHFPPDRLFLGGSPQLMGLPAGDGHRERPGSKSQLRQQLEVDTGDSRKKEKSRKQLAPQRSRHPRPMSITAPDPRGQPVPATKYPSKGKTKVGSPHSTALSPFRPMGD